MSSLFGHLPDGRAVHRLAIGSAPGAVLHVLTLGATIHRLEVTGGDGERRNVALGYGDVATYVEATDYLGATVGRYANRIAHGRCEVAGREVALSTNDRGHHLHGGEDGFDARLWEVVEHEADRVTLRLLSPDGDQGHPGAVTAEARFAVEGDEVRLDLVATTDAPTLVNLSSHCYLNLAGAGSGTTVDDHLLSVPAARYTPVDATSIPTGELADVAGTPLDLREPRRVGEAARAVHPQTTPSQGPDHNLVVDGEELREVAVLEDPASRTRMVLHADQPGLQVYLGNKLDGTHALAEGVMARQGDGLALEPQVFPDSPHHPAWPQALLQPGQTYRSRIRWSFSAT